MAKNKIQPNLCLETFFELPIKNGDVIKHNLAVNFFFLSGARNQETSSYKVFRRGPSGGCKQCPG